MVEREIIFRCRYSQEFKDTFRYQLNNGDRLGSIIAYSRYNSDIVYVLWDGRVSLDRIHISYVDILEEPVAAKPVNLGMPSVTPEKLKLLQEEARKRHAESPAVVIRPETPILKLPKESIAVIAPVRAEKVKKQPVKKKKVSNIFNSQVESKPKIIHRAIFNPADRVPIKRPPAVYDNQNKSLYGINYNE
jgi:hypothetical protein